MVINKLVISEEAVFDYEECLLFGRLPKAEIKAEVEEYIEHQISNYRLMDCRYFRITFFDEYNDEMLMLFIYRADKVGPMQMWLLKGICSANDWDEDLEHEGQIRRWLNTKEEELPEETDWVVGLRVWQLLMYTEKTLYENVLTEVLNAFDSERDKEIAAKMALLQSIHFDTRGKQGTRKKTSGNRKGG